MKNNANGPRTIFRHKTCDDRLAPFAVGLLGCAPGSGYERRAPGDCGRIRRECARVFAATSSGSRTFSRERASSNRAGVLRAGARKCRASQESCTQSAPRRSVSVRRITIAALNDSTCQNGKNLTIDQSAADYGSLRCLVIGRVQGVYFRASAAAKAKTLGLRGSARNLDDGRVEIVIHGQTECLTDMVGWLWDGPLDAQVNEVVVEVYVGPAPSGFTIQ
jgi:acylphosphatase